MAMKTLALAALAATTALAASASLAARGDKLYIALEDVSVRDTPSAEAPRVIVLDRGHMVVEVSTTGRWMKVAVAHTDGIMGWVARRELTTVKPSPLPPIPRPAFEYFVSSVEQFNREIANETGRRLYRRIQAITDDVISLTAGELWFTLPRRAMRKNLRLMADRWAALNGTGNPTWIQVVDRTGAVMMRERRGS